MDARIVYNRDRWSAVHPLLECCIAMLGYHGENVSSWSRVISSDGFRSGYFPVCLIYCSRESTFHRESDVV